MEPWMPLFTEHGDAYGILDKFICGVVEVDLQSIHVCKAQQEWRRRIQHLKVDFSNFCRDLHGADRRCDVALVNLMEAFPAVDVSIVIVRSSRVSARYCSLLTVDTLAAPVSGRIP